MERYWVPHPQLVHAPCKLQKENASDVLFTDEDDKEITIPKASFAGLSKVAESQTRGVDNICTLEEAHAAALLHTVRTRYFRGQIYTRVSRILIAVNPFQPLPIYTSHTMSKYVTSGDSLDLAPHIYGIGQDAVCGLQRSARSQVVLIGGESGAGKTESTKQVMSYFAEAIGGDSGVEGKIVRTNPVLEAFGNAMTARNNNSSRFGKFLEVWVDSKSNLIQGCSVTDYLLEVTRVCTQAEHERNYHIFFQLTSCRAQAVLGGLGILEPSAYRYLERSQFVAPGIDDVRCFDELREALSALGFSDAEQLQIFKIVAGILVLGNCDFGDADQASVTNQDVLAQASALLGVKADALRSAMTVKRIVVGREVTETTRSSEQARDARDSLSRLMYGRLFKWLIQRMNRILSDGARPGRFFGVLDIAGFESFEHNSLEQLFINLSNEQLQQHFNAHVFKAQLAEYETEGITIEGGINFKDNSDVVALLDARGGILPALDEEVALPKGTDGSFVSKMLKAHESHPRFVVPKFGGSSALRFGIRHFAGEVQYECAGFLHKNIDKPPENAPALFKSSQLAVLSQVGAMVEEELAEGGGRGNKKPKTVSAGFRASLAALMEKLNSAEPHFVRCVKPNSAKVPSSFDSRLSMEQLVNSGVMEAIQIRQRGFASRFNFQEFTTRYHIIARTLRSQVPEDSGSTAETTQALASALCNSVGCSQEADFKVGATKVFLTAPFAKALEVRRDLSIVGYAVHIQRVFRGKRARHIIGSCKSIAADLEQWCDRNQGERQAPPRPTADLFEGEAAEGQHLVHRASALPVRLPKLPLAQRTLARVVEQAKLLRELPDFETGVDPVEIEKALARATELHLPQYATEKLSARCGKLKTQLPLVKAMKIGMENEDLAQLQEVFEAVKKAGYHMSPEMWLPELGGSELASRTYDTIESLKAKQKLEQIEQERRKTLENKIHREDVNTFEEAEKPPAPPSTEIKKRHTITGMSSERQDEVLEALQQAMQEHDMTALEEHLGDAMREGIFSSLLEDAETLLASMQSEAFIEKALAEAVASVRDDPQRMAGLRSLQNLVQQARKLGMDSEALLEAESELLQGMKRVARRVSNKRLFEAADRRDLEKMTKDLSLANFHGLKPLNQWSGHRSKDTASFFTRALTKKKGRDGGMLLHNTCDIREALTKVPSNLEGQARHMFHDLLGWMGDRPVSENERQGYAHGIVEMARSHAALADEVYVQVMKQLSGNPSTRSSLLGAKLLLLLTQQVCPSDELEEFVRSFLLKSTGAPDDELAAISRQCLEDLNQTVTCSQVAIQPDEHLPVSVQVRLIDNSTRRIRAQQNATLSELKGQVAAVLRISNASDFCFFQMTDGLDTHRMLPDEASLVGVMIRWEKLKANTGRNSHFLFKRRFLRVDENLDAGDLMHSTLTYKQAVCDYLAYPVSDDSNLVRKIAALHLSIEAPEMLHSLEQPGELERFVPEQLIKEQKRAQWARQIEAAAREDDADPREARLVKMSRALALMQKLKLFGAHYWLGRQKLQVSDDRVPIQEAPAEICKVNPMFPEAEYWICVDYFGIRFMSVDSAPGQGFVRGFLFDSEAMERVLQWGSKGNIAQFVVQCVSTAATTSDCRAPMIISMMTPAAVDIAYVVHSVTTERAAYAAERARGH